jgi:hypothetical protein
MNPEEQRELVEEYGAGFERLRAALHDIPVEAWAFKPDPKEWSVRELVFHMTDSETLGVTRLNMIVAMPGSTLMSYEDEAWANALSYPGRDIEDALEIFRLLRKSTQALLKSVPRSAFENSVIHPDNPCPEFGDIFSIEKWLRIYSRHVRDHIEQLQAIHRAWKEKQA